MLGSPATSPRFACWKFAGFATLLAVLVWWTTSKNSPEPGAFHDRYGPAAFIAGASEGLGAAWADYLAARGFDLFLVARHLPALDAVAEDLRSRYGVSVQTISLDLGSKEVAAFGTELFRQHPEINLVIYNAAYTGSQAGFFASDSLSMAQGAVDVNIRGVMSLIHPFLNGKLDGVETDEAARGGVLLMSSMAGVVGSAHITAYAATKAWNTAFATGLYEELRHTGIDVMACLAGATTTPNYMEKANPMRDRTIEQEPADVVDECASAFGHVPTRATGWVNRIGQVALARFLPTWLSVHIVSEGTRHTTTFDMVSV